MPGRTPGQFSFYRGPISNTKPNGLLDMPKLIGLIKSQKYLSITQKLRAEPDKGVRESIKRGLDYITPAGVFQARKNDKLLTPSGLACLDLDHLPASEIGATQSQLRQNHFCHALFVSPSGSGLKVFFKIPATLDADRYKTFYRSFAATLGVRVDEGACDIARACFLCHDPEPFFNPDSRPWEKAEGFQEITTPRDETRSGVEFRKILRLMKEGLSDEQIRARAKGERWGKWNEDSLHYQNRTLKTARDSLRQNPPREPEQFSISSLPEALKDLKPRQWLVKGLLPAEGIICLAAPPKCYKSILAFHLALCAATGRRLLNHFELEKTCRVLIIQEENSVDMLEKFSLLVNGMNLNSDEVSCLNGIKLSMNNFFVLDSPEQISVERLRKLISESQPDIVVYDSVVRMMSGEENSAKDVRKVFRTLKKISGQKPLLHFLIHHTNKARRQEDLQVRGSGDFLAMSDVVIQLYSKPLYGGWVFAAVPYNRAAPGNKDFKFKVWAEGPGGKPTTDISRIKNIKLGEFSEVEDACKNQNEQLVWNWLSTNGQEWFSVGQVWEAREWGFEKRTMTNILQRFVSRGKLQTRGELRTLEYRLRQESLSEVETWEF